VVSAWMGARYTLQNGGSGGIQVFGGGLFQEESLWGSGYGYGFIRVRMWFRQGATVVVIMNGECRC
jgi:hypothetical protein